MKYNILVVDDEPNNLELVARTFKRRHNVFLASSPDEGLAVLQKNKIDLIISDQKMPDMDGVEFLKQSLLIAPNSVRILITAYSDANSIISAINEVKINRYIKKPWSPEDLTNVVNAALEVYQLNIDNQNLVNDLQELFSGTIFAITEALDAKDPYTSGRSKRVTYYSNMLGKYIKLSDIEMTELELAGLLHDIGMIGVSEDILHKQEALTKEEFESIKRHVGMGVKILEDIKQLNTVLRIIEAHHERYDGLGYPNGLKGVEMPIAARIIAVADAYDGMVSDRSYRKGLPHETAIEEIKKSAGKQFDPYIVEAFVEIIEKLIVDGSQDQIAT